jgi:hypothetical protein
MTPANNLMTMQIVQGPVLLALLSRCHTSVQNFAIVAVPLFANKLAGDMFFRRVQRVLKRSLPAINSENIIIRIRVKIS